jgi:transcriptional regulator with XRE-family HTH domain
MVLFHGKFCFMSKPAHATEILPAAVARALKDLGENLALARQRRKESQRTWATRLSVSVPTLIRMEKGDPSVGMGVYATALWLMGRHAALPEMAAPAQDLNALEQDIEAVRQRSKRLSRKPEQAL